MQLTSDIVIKILKAVKGFNKTTNKDYFRLVIDNGDDRFNDILKLSCTQEVYNLVADLKEKLYKPYSAQLSWRSFKGSWFPVVTKVFIK